MTPEQIALVRASYDALSPDRATMATEFYRRLFATDPSARELFNTNVSEMAVKFSVELEALVDTISSFPEFSPRVRELGARHAGYGVRAAHYGSVREALIGALAEHLAARWNAELEAAWYRAFNLVAEVMMAGAADATRSAPRA
jgi:hemoglobin-like flavoprotein